jgi:hypothetical protein
MSGDKNILTGEEMKSVYNYLLGRAEGIVRSRRGRYWREP